VVWTIVDHSHVLHTTLMDMSGMQDTAVKMLSTTSPAEHQKLGRQVKNYDGKTWDASKCLL